MASGSFALANTDPAGKTTTERIKKRLPLPNLGEGKDSRDGIHLSCFKEHAKPAGTTISNKTSFNIKQLQLKLLSAHLQAVIKNRKTYNFFVKYIYYQLRKSKKITNKRLTPQPQSVPALWWWPPVSSRAFVSGIGSEATNIIPPHCAKGSHRQVIINFKLPDPDG